MHFGLKPTTELPRQLLLHAAIHNLPIYLLYTCMRSTFIVFVIADMKMHINTHHRYGISHKFHGHFYGKLLISVVKHVVTLTCTYMYNKSNY